MDRKYWSKLLTGALCLITVSMSLGLGAKKADASEIQLDNKQTISVEAPYNDPQIINDVSQAGAVYGKLVGDTPIDIYQFTAKQDGEQTFSLLVLNQEAAKLESQPLLILVDKTGKNDGQTAGIPTPSEEYGSFILKETEIEQLYNEPVLLEQYRVAVEQKVTLVKDATYYLVVLDPSRKAETYAIKFGDSKVWGGTDFFKHMGTWWTLKFDLFGGVTPYHFGAVQAGLIIFLLGFVVLLGVWFVFNCFILTANRSKSAAYLAVKMTPYTRIASWVALWFTLIGGYLFFSRLGWSGVPFVLLLIFIPILILTLVDSIALAPKLMRVEIAHKEASLTKSLKQGYLVTFILSLLAYLTFVVYLTIFFA